MLDHTRKELASSEAGTSSPPLKHHNKRAFQGKIWATRKNIHIDRLCSAWLIKKFIDPKAKFVFAHESSLPPKAIPFDVMGVAFSHHGEDCTFETLLKSFRIKDRALALIAQIVHDVDLKDEKFGRPEAAGLGAVVRALSNSLKDDHQVLEVGAKILDALYADLSATKKRP